MEENKIANIGNEIESIIMGRVKEVLSKREIPEAPGELIQTDNLGEVLDKLVIMHIRMWMLEDAAGTVKNDEEYVKVRKKIDILYKNKRPSFIGAINKLTDKAIIEGKSLTEDSVKLYNGEEN